MKKQTINPIRGERLRTILNETGITQGKLSKETGIAQQNLSAAIKGKINLTETSVRAIIDVLPQYRFEWLFGLDDYKTLAEFNLHQIGEIQKEGAALTAAVCTLAQLCGYSVLRLEDRWVAAHSVEEIVREIYGGYKYTFKGKGKGKGKTFSLTLEEQSALENEICEFVEFKLSKYQPRP